MLLQVAYGMPPEQWYLDIVAVALDSTSISAVCRQASLRQDEIKFCTPSARMLASIIGGPGGCVGFIWPAT